MADRRQAYPFPSGEIRPHQLLQPRRLPMVRMQAYPVGDGPYERWELSEEVSGEVFGAGAMAEHEDAVQGALQAHKARFEDRETRLTFGLW